MWLNLRDEKNMRIVHPRVIEELARNIKKIHKTKRKLQDQMNLVLPFLRAGDEYNKIGFIVEYQNSLKTIDKILKQIQHENGLWIIQG